MRACDLVHLLQTRCSPEDEVILYFDKEGCMLAEAEEPNTFTAALELNFDSVFSSDGYAYIDLPHELCTQIRSF